MTRNRRYESLVSDPTAIVRQRQMVILKFDGGEWNSIIDRPHGSRRFSMTCDVSLLEGVRTPTFCLIYAEDYFSDDTSTYLGVLKSKQRTATLGGTITVRECHPVVQAELGDLVEALDSRRYRNDLLDRAGSDEQRIVRLSPGLAATVMDCLTANGKNRSAIDRLLRSGLLTTVRRRRASVRLQRNAIQMALAASGLPKDSAPTFLDVRDEDDTALYELEGRLQEDAVIAHDARQIAGMDYVGSRLTGVARFEDRGTVLDVVTGNKLPLEEALGVDLVYINETQKNVALVQYKMLDRNGRDWLYRPNRQLANEIARMRKLTTLDGRRAWPYRLSPEYLFLKFVKRDSRDFSAPVILPLTHFEQLSQSPEHKGPKGAFRISYKTLAGHYLREQPFLDLIRDGYLGSYASTTAKIKALIRKLIAEGRPAVVAIRRQLVLAHNEVADSDDPGFV